MILPAIVDVNESRPVSKPALDLSELVYVPSPTNSNVYRCGEFFTRAVGMPGDLARQHFDKPFIFMG
jgi:hypothetical protein